MNNRERAFLALSAIAPHNSAAFAKNWILIFRFSECRKPNAPMRVLREDGSYGFPLVMMAGARGGWEQHQPHLSSKAQS
jgi:hypothetical protein